MTRRLISSRSGFGERIGCSRAAVDGDFVFVSGTTGYDDATMSIPDSVVERCERCFRNIGAALREAGASIADVVRATFIVPRRADREPCRPVIRRHFGQTRPASTMFHAGLRSDQMRIGIEVTARPRRRGGER